jgi:hypothetical protein
MGPMVLGAVEGKDCWGTMARRFGVLGAGVDLAGGDEQEADLGARECCRSGRRPMRKMVATIFFFWVIHFWTFSDSWVFF